MEKCTDNVLIFQIQMSFFLSAALTKEKYLDQVVPGSVATERFFISVQDTIPILFFINPKFKESLEMASNGLYKLKELKISALKLNLLNNFLKKMQTLEKQAFSCK